jgi:hypothetical protein
LLDAISNHTDTTFTPGDLVPRLAQSEAWGRTLAEAKGRDDDSVRVTQAAKVGYFLRNFRLRGKKNSTGHMAYERQAAMACLSAHLPQNPPNSPQAPPQHAAEMQVAGNSSSPEGTEATESFAFPPPQIGSANHEPSGGHGVNVWTSASKEAVALLRSDEDTCAGKDGVVEGEI